MSEVQPGIGGSKLVNRGSNQEIGCLLRLRVGLGCFGTRLAPFLSGRYFECCGRVFSRLSLSAFS